MTAAREIAKQRLIVNSEKMKERFDAHRRANDFQVGDQVWLWCVMHKSGNATKLEKSYKGPFTIISQTAANNFEIESSTGKRDVVNVERLKPFICRPASLSLTRSDRFPSPANNSHDSSSLPVLLEDEKESCDSAPLLQEEEHEHQTEKGSTNQEQYDSSSLPLDASSYISPLIRRRSGRERKEPDRYQSLIRKRPS